MNNNEWQSISDDIDLTKEDIEQDNKYRDKEKDSEYSWDRI